MADAAQIVLNDTLGAAFIGVVVSGCFLHSSLVLLHTPKRPMAPQDSVYAYTITNWGNQSFLGEIPRTLVVQVLFSGLTAFMVQCFLASRIWRLSDRKGWLIAIIVCPDFEVSHVVPWLTASQVLLIVGEFGLSLLVPPLEAISTRFRCRSHFSPRNISKISVCDHSEGATRSKCHSERRMKDMGDIVKFLTLFKTLWHLSLVIGELCARNIEQPATLFALRAAFLGAGIRLAIDPEIVRKTWDGVPHDEQGLPDNWISESWVLVGMRGRN
ncbi:uncharacterized protein LACBIDRAFT_332915 [Laccaria bicolor S238N-H82]|uniref:Predicted protein n=1 Tax=Laccaria bicolor (strain S238N-H82 / ATCC MYA-4686) TaxID=486041 RepID=B0DU92_LACBS|nr:uncharacterized protein LACBIDRAFT_332915 [Laccaria bicolor S238N-H82]EDR01863.1 predicted protein [Laccaria bicolor S238N-H82]|eukprot:XP_001887473.1 predicted protein [Laccaria bicolor S238N-H82]